MRRELKLYYKEVTRHLHCARNMRKNFIAETQRMAEDYAASNPDATFPQLKEFLGDPKDLAETFNQTLSPEHIVQYRKRRICIRISMIAILVAVVVAIANGIWYWRWSNVWYDVQVIKKETAITVYPSLTRNSTIRVEKKAEYTFNDVTIAVITLKVAFDYSGSSAWVVRSSGSNTFYNGWSYSGQSITNSSGKSVLTGKLSKSGTGNVAVDLTLKCSAAGSIS